MNIEDIKKGDTIIYKDDANMPMEVLEIESLAFKVKFLDDDDVKWYHTDLLMHFEKSIEAK